MKRSVVLAVLIGILVLACSSVAPAPAEPTSKIDATVEARLLEDKLSLPTATRYLTDIPVPLPTNTPKSEPMNIPAPTAKPTQFPGITQIRQPTAFVSSKDYREFDTGLRTYFKLPWTTNS